jgi:hypothetical protein
MHAHRRAIWQSYFTDLSQRLRQVTVAMRENRFSDWPQTEFILIYPAAQHAQLFVVATTDPLSLDEELFERDWGDVGGLWHLTTKHMEMAQDGRVQRQDVCAEVARSEWWRDIAGVAQARLA